MRKVTASRMRERYAQTVPTFRLTYVFKKYVHQTCNDKSPLLLATLLCLSPEYLLRSISGERPTVVANMKGYHFSLISFLHRCNFPMKTFTVLITSHAAVVGEEIQVEMKHVYL